MTTDVNVRGTLNGLLAARDTGAVVVAALGVTPDPVFDEERAGDVRTPRRKHVGPACSATATEDMGLRLTVDWLKEHP